jgi:diguanylate cyclase (GGDEF)-like protein
VLALLTKSLLALIDAIVGGGYAVALAVVCLLQYALCMHYRYRAHRRVVRLELDVEHLESECAQIRNDRRLSRHEMLALREFVSQPDWRGAVLSLLRKFVPASQQGFAAYFRDQEGLPILSQQHGLSPESAERLTLDARLLSRLESEPVIALSGNILQKSKLWDDLGRADRQKVQTLYVLPLEGTGFSAGWILTTSLLPPDAPFADQQPFTLRLLTSIAPMLRDKMQLAAQDDDLRSSSEMLTMRSVLDQPWESPAQMLEELLSLAAGMLDADRAALFLHNPDGVPAFKALIRTGANQPAGIRDAWQISEDTLVQASRELREATRFDTACLHRLKIRALIGSALIVPITALTRLIGVVAFTRRGSQPMSDRQLHQAEWIGRLLAETIPRLGSQAAAERQARLDGLTGLANRKTFDSQFAQNIAIAQSTRGVCSLLLLDLDHFKSINDQLGHQAGDEVLRRTAAVVQECAAGTRAYDPSAGNTALAARYGGEELALLLPGVDEQSALRIAEDCRVRIEFLDPRIGGTNVPVTSSIGVATYPAHGRSAEELFAAADAALYEAKSLGRNRVCVAEPLTALSVV